MSEECKPDPFQGVKPVPSMTCFHKMHVSTARQLCCIYEVPSTQEEVYCIHTKQKCVSAYNRLTESSLSPTLNTNRRAGLEMEPLSNCRFFSKTSRLCVRIRTAAFLSDSLARWFEHGFCFVFFHPKPSVTQTRSCPFKLGYDCVPIPESRLSQFTERPGLALAEKNPWAYGERFYKSSSNCFIFDHITS